MSDKEISWKTNMDEKYFFTKIQCPVKHYAWGECATGSKKPYIASLLGIEPGAEPWAELWIGAHPAASAVIEASGTPLNKAIEQDASGMLGAMADSSSAVLPFLLKILCCSSPLSIQSHPDKKTAAVLHANLPGEFPDANHKPEILMAISEFKVMGGFRTIEDIIADLRSVPAFAPWLDACSPLSLKTLCEYVLNADAKKLADMADAAMACSLPDNANAQLFKMLDSRYHGDCGTFFAFLLNVFTLKPGEAIFIGPNIPHAYVDGQGIECMANSDNVIRAGLTPKYVNRQLLLDTLDFSSRTRDMLAAKSLPESNAAFDFECPGDFRLKVIDFANGAYELEGGRPAVLIVLKGTVRLTCGKDAISAKNGSTWFAPASMKHATLVPEEAECMVVMASI